MAPTGQWAAASDDQVKGDERAQGKNIILLGATLHLTSNVVRGIVLFFSLPMQLAITDVVHADAVCALIVGGCTLLGSVVFFLRRGSMIQTLPSSWQSSS